jgi:hypothetical protein
MRSRLGGVGLTRGLGGGWRGCGGAGLGRDDGDGGTLGLDEPTADGTPSSFKIH